MNILYVIRWPVVSVVSHYYTPSLYLGAFSVNTWLGYSVSTPLFGMAWHPEVCRPGILVMWSQSHDWWSSWPGPSPPVKHPSLASCSQAVTTGPKQIWPDCPIFAIINSILFITRVVTLFCNKHVYCCSLVYYQCVLGQSQLTWIYVTCLWQQKITTSIVSALWFNHSYICTGFAQYFPVFRWKFTDATTKTPCPRDKNADGKASQTSASCCGDAMLMPPDPTLLDPTSLQGQPRWLTPLPLLWCGSSNNLVVCCPLWFLSPFVLPLVWVVLLKSCHPHQPAAMVLMLLLTIAIRKTLTQSSAAF